MADSVLSLFTTDQTARLTKLTARQLAYWDTTGFYAAHQHDDVGTFRRAYSLRDVIELRTLQLIRKQVRLQQLREVKRRLHSYDEPWANLRFWLAGGTVYWEDPASQIWESVRPKNQTVIPVEMKKVERDVKRAVRQLVIARDPEDIGHISQNRYVQHNEPVASGTRVPVAAILDFHNAGYSPSEIIAEYPRLRLEDVAAAIEWGKARKAS